MIPIKAYEIKAVIRNIIMKQDIPFITYLDIGT
jgi:hypothetical protein